MKNVEPVQVPSTKRLNGTIGQGTANEDTFDLTYKNLKREGKRDLI